MIVGWLEDPAEKIGFVGGAELDSAALRAASPHELVPMPPGRVESDADAYIVTNCVYYAPADISAATGPLVKVVNDAWKYGDREVRAMILDQAALVVFRSPLHLDRFEHEVTDGADVAVIPSHVNLPLFRAAAGTVDRQDRVVWLAHILSRERLAGYNACARWADERGLEIDGYGKGTTNGTVDYRDVPRLFAGYRWYAHAMGNGHYEPFGRTTVEAWAAGCNLAVGEDTGAAYWIEERPHELERAADTFWETFDRTVERCGSLSSL